ncbi:MAG: monovalent cation/H(+) antiporter subunit G [Pseudomonadota bacterium]|nr:monovalent cation/H(+) antiporter subunit G [Pseudomonadota bacterium]
MNGLEPLLDDLNRWLPFAIVLLGAGFFLAGTVGLLRFPDVLARLHALTKADNLGLGLICLGLAWRAGSAGAALKLLLIWLLALLASSVSCHLVARHALRDAPRNQR